MSVADKAKEFYENELQSRLENEHSGKFVAIEPESRSFFVADTFVEAALAARDAHPDRTSFVIRIGYDATFHIGAGSL